MVESTQIEDMVYFPYYLDPDTRKITRILEKIKLETINKKCSIVFKKKLLE